MRRFLCLGSTLVSLAFVGATVAVRAEKPAITVVDVGGFGTNGASAAYGIANGLAVGYAQNTGRNARPNAIESRGAGLDVVGAGLFASRAVAINAAGVAVGNVALPDGSQQRAVAFVGKRIAQLGVLPHDDTSFASAINAAGTIVGTSIPATSTTYVSQAFVARHGTIYGIDALRAVPKFLGANARAINDSGVVAGGYAFRTGFLATVASYAWNGKSLETFAVVHGGRGASQATAVNAHGLIVGYYSTFGFSVNAPLHAYAYDGKTLHDFGTLFPNAPFALSFANAVNARGVVVGWSQASRATQPSATAFTRGAVLDLNTLLPANSGWQLLVAYGIDDAGNVAGIGLHDGIERGFILRTGATLHPSL